MTMVPAAPVNPVRSEAQGLLAHSGVKAFMKNAKVKMFQNPFCRKNWK